MLQPEQAAAYAMRWREHGDREAACHLITSHLRLVAKIACDIRVWAADRQSFPKERWANAGGEVL
jgi:hypothetical protein